MKALRKFGSLSVKWNSSVTSVRNEYTVTGMRVIKPKSLTGIPDASRLWREYRCMEITKNNAIKLVLDELIGECGMSNLPLSQLEKKDMMKLRVDTLVQHNMVPSLSAVVDGLLSHLEPFPFNHGEITANKNILTVKFIRDVIARQYLAWKFKMSVQDISNTFYRFRLSLFEFQSMRNLRRNTDMIESLPGMYKLNVSEKIYHINQTPFNLSSILNFQETLVGVNWNMFSQFCPKMLQHSYQYVLFLISNLQKMQFTDTQIREALPFLHLNFVTILCRLNFILTHPKISKFRKEDKFLQLLSYNIYVLNYSFDLQKDGFSELIDLIRIGKLMKSLNLCTTRPLMYNFVEFLAVIYNFRTSLCMNSILFCISQFYSVDSSFTKALERHEMRKLVSEEQIMSTLSFLKNQGFKDEEVAESITIILYPRSLVEKGLEKVKEEESELEAYGFKNGCVTERTDFFRAGTKSKEKILQLCLYYIEKSFNFSGSRVLDSETENVTLDDTISS